MHHLKYVHLTHISAHLRRTMVLVKNNLSLKALKNKHHQLRSLKNAVMFTIQPSMSSSYYGNMMVNENVLRKHDTIVRNNSSLTGIRLLRHQNAITSCVKEWWIIASLSALYMSLLSINRALLAPCKKSSIKRKKIQRSRERRKDLLIKGLLLKTA